MESAAVVAELRAVTWASIWEAMAVTWAWSPLLFAAWSAFKRFVI